ncbi:phosphatidylinositol glycan, class Q [Trichoderma citrinoviride]|uniref:Phosphatidylinositol glycan, class Q n=1 Tax=Trichoderma citrinoviride TaxID=58853 RepID=A0A2T4AYC6_9HYPO|nr:phosphatidylinositol glycan, class Q [Trichoderma citrinoviride]PTB61961.1 phosphatidylinositol glycan, class Q [Trichoderma citrinoviride]
MHPFSTVTLGIFVAGYITARWDLVTRLYELAIFAVEYGVVLRVARGIVVLTAFYLAIFVPVALLARRETSLHPRDPGVGISAREQLKRRGSI